MCAQLIGYTSTRVMFDDLRGGIMVRTDFDEAGTTGGAKTVDLSMSADSTVWVCRRAGEPLRKSTVEREGCGGGRGEARGVRVIFSVPTSRTQAPIFIFNRRGRVGGEGRAGGGDLLVRGFHGERGLLDSSGVLSSQHPFFFRADRNRCGGCDGRFHKPFFFSRMSSYVNGGQRISACTFLALFFGAYG